MSEKLIKDKPKRGEQEVHVAIDFILPLQLEQCFYHISQRPRETPLQVTLESVEADSAHFVARLEDDNLVTVRYSGELQRWEGTGTQVTGHVVKYGLFFPNNVLISSLLWGLIWLAVGIPATLVLQFDIHWLAGLLLGASLLLFVRVVYLLIRSWYRARARQELIVRLKRVLSGTEIAPEPTLFTPVKDGDPKHYVPIEFTESLSLKQCLANINQQRVWRPVRVELARGSAGTVQFVALLRHSGEVVAAYTGELGQSEGITTHVSGQVETQKVTITTTEFMSGYFVFCLVTSGYVTLILLRVGETNPVVSGISAILFYTAMYIFAPRFRRLTLRRELISRFRRILNGTET
ncbi:MAG TPA: hypothetical protein VHO69_08170 [Phototrophicaceae bacterium]|nr:hypothetical protein [Phototrophicaceae bacterium]